MHYKDLIVWQKSIELARIVYELTEKFPKQEQFGLMSQMRRAAVSIPSNIAEGSRRATKKDYRHFLFNAFGSGAELETQLVLAESLKFAVQSDFVSANKILDEVMRMLNKLIQELVE